MFKHNPIFDRTTNCRAGAKHMLWAADVHHDSTGLYGLFLSFYFTDQVFAKRNSESSKLLSLITISARM
jgi:hypothetical protein